MSDRKNVPLGFFDAFYSVDDFGREPDTGRPVKLIEVSTLIDQAELMIRAALEMPGLGWTKWPVKVIKMKIEPNYVSFRINYWYRKAFNIFIDFEPERKRRLFIDTHGRARTKINDLSFRIEFDDPGRVSLGDALTAVERVAELMQLAKLIEWHIDQYVSGEFAGGFGWYCVESLRGDDHGEKET